MFVACRLSVSRRVLSSQSLRCSAPGPSTSAHRLPPRHRRTKPRMATMPFTTPTWPSPKVPTPLRPHRKILSARARTHSIWTRVTMNLLWRMF